MFTWMRIFEIVVCGVLLGPNHGLTLTPANFTTCEEFENGAHFVPHDVVDSAWRIFYFWAENTEVTPVVFSLPALKRIQRFKAIVDAIDPNLGVEWYKATLMMEPRPGVQILLLYLGTVGAFRALVKIEDRNKERPLPQPYLKFADVRLKVVGRYMGMMCCEDFTMYALAREKDVPETETECENAARSLGFRGDGGRSHLHVKKLMRSEEL